MNGCILLTLIRVVACFFSFLKRALIVRIVSVACGAFGGQAESGEFAVDNATVLAMPSGGCVAASDSLADHSPSRTRTPTLYRQCV
jgi:hypothetical protein